MVAEHPAVKVREVTLTRLARLFPNRCEADREDAVHEALCAALEHGHADSQRTVQGWAARRLMGQQVRRGKVYSARSPATSIATSGYSLGEGVLDPADWLDGSSAFATAPNPEAALDLERWQGRDWTAEALRLLGEARAAGLSWSAISRAAGQRSAIAPIRWASGERTIVHPDAVAVDLDDHLREAAARARRVEEARREQQRRDEAARKRAQRALATFVSRRAKVVRVSEAQRLTREVLHGRGLCAVGALVGVTKSTVARWRDGHATPGAEYLSRLRAIAVAPQRSTDCP